MTTAKKDKEKPTATKQNFPIVGIGASAGGLDAFKRLLQAIPEDSGMAYVLVQHLDPTHESMLPEILSRTTKIPVHEITDDIALAPDHIYIIPSNKILISTDGVLQLAPRDKKTLNLCIDIFFTSLAEVHTHLAVGVVLSGTGTDGTLGLKAIKAHGGTTFAQDSESAAYDSMPQSAIHAGVVDFVLLPEQIPAHLLQINRTEEAHPAYIPDGEDEAEPILSKDDEDFFDQILLLLGQRSGVDFTYYKRPTLQRRIERRMTIAKKASLADYLVFLRDNKGEQDALFQDVLIPVTSFFRDPKVFQTLSDTLFPALFKHKPHDEPIRVWIAGCSTGEEAFSIAICLHEFLSKKGNPPFWGRSAIQIFASDISESAIKKARAGIYDKAEVEHLSEARVKNYFTKNKGGYEVVKVIRDMCVFAQHNFLKDPPFAKIDLISCRNVLIYMDTFLQRKALTTFHYVLKENGFLLLGKSETTGPATELFLSFDKREKIYSRKSVPGRFLHVATERKAENSVPRNSTAITEATQTDFRKSAEAILLAKFTPASVVVNEGMDVVHIHGNIAPFLEQPQGKPSFNLLKMAREGLGFELRNALHKAKTSGAAVSKENIPVAGASFLDAPDNAAAQGKPSLVTIQVVPLNDTVEQHFLILFTKNTPRAAEETGPNASAGRTKDKEGRERIQYLEQELAHNREDMRGITEEMEAVNEELQSGNEELQSGNEEMQSLNEELETSKEELQSINEELITVNQELLERQEQLNASRIYAEAIVTTIREPLVILDQSLRIKTANAAFYKKFKVDEKETEGKLIYEVQQRQFDDATLRSLLEQILPQKNRIDDFEITLKLPSMGEHILLLNARQIVNEKPAEQLILLAMEDIKDRILAEKSIHESEAKFRQLILQAPYGIVILQGPTFVVETVNETALKMWGMPYEEVINKPYFEVSPESDDPLKKILTDVYATGESLTINELQMSLRRNEKLETVYFNVVYQPLRNQENKITGIIVMAEVVTENVHARQQIEASETKFRNLILQAPVAIATFTGPSFIVETANKAILDIWEKTNEQMVNKPYFEMVPERGAEIKNMFHSVYTTGLPIERKEFPVAFERDGKTVIKYFDSVMQPLRNAENEVVRLILVLTEVTENLLARKQIEASEKWLSNILTQSLMAIAILKGPEMVVTFANDPLLEIWGKGNDVVGKPLLEVLPEIINQPFPQLLRDVYTTGVPFATNEIMAVIVRNGKSEECYFNLIYQPYTDVDNTITGVTILAKETTEYVIARKLVEESAALAEAAKENAIAEKAKAEAAMLRAEEAMQSKQRFLSNMSHEIRTPMNAIIGFSKVMLKTTLSSKQEEYMQAIQASGDTMIVLINDILDLAKVDAGKMTFVQTPFKLAVSVTTMLHLFETKVQEKNIALVKEYDDRIPAVLLGDAVRLHQVILNLVSNAVKFTAQGTITVRVILLEENEQYATIEMNVTDTGIGIAEDQIGHIFENFRQASNATSSLYGGTGLGLAIVKQLVESQGGTIHVNSKIGEGSTFGFILRFEKTDTELENEKAPAEPEAENKHIRILVAEDVPLNQLLMRTILDDFGFTSDYAANGKIAVEKMQANAYDIVLMDLQMPEMNGFEATEYVRKTMGSKIPIIALTADVTTADMEKCTAVGMDDYVSKPVD